MKLVGNARVRRAIEAAGGENPFHAYIISGPDGSGKTLTSRLLASALVCTESPSRRPCGKCLACRKVAHGTHPDVRVVEMEGKESFLVGQSRELRADASRLPNEGRHKIYILPDADHMNEAASNALLKILEEPPEYTVITLIAENPAALPETVRSRCVELRLRPVSTEEGLGALSEMFPEEKPEVLRSALEKGGNLVGKAADVVLGRETEAAVALLAAEAVFARDEFGLLTALMSLEKAGKEEIRRELGELAKILSRGAMGSAKTELSPREICLAANKAAELYGKSALYISAGNLLAGAAAELSKVIAKEKK